MVLFACANDLELLGKVFAVHFQIGFSPRDPRDDFFNVGQVLVQFVALLLDFQEPLGGLVDLCEGVDEGVREVVEHAARTRVAARAAPAAAGPHGGVPVVALEEAVEKGRLELWWPGVVDGAKLAVRKAQDEERDRLAAEAVERAQMWTQTEEVEDAGGETQESKDGEGDIFME